MSALLDALDHDPDPSPARLRTLLEADLARGTQELAKTRSGYDSPVTVAIAPGLVAVAPIPPELRADPAVVDERGWLLVAALVGALVQAGARELRTGRALGHLALAAQGASDAELAALAFDESIAHVDRLRARAVALPDNVIDPSDLKDPIGAAHPLKIAEAVATLGANPADPAQAELHEEAILASLTKDHPEITRPHDDPDPARRVARRILQRLNGMGKWGGYHTEFTHLPRGFSGNDRELAARVGEALIKAELLVEKTSVGQRHVFLNPRRAKDIYALIDEGRLPPALKL